MSGFTLLSPEFFDLAWLDRRHEFNGFDGAGENRSPALQWSGAPAAAKSFAVTLYDPDAPTGSGFWHWVAFDIPSSVSTLSAGAGSTGTLSLAAGGTQSANDFGVHGYGGPCPPKGAGAHRYVFTVHALSQERLGVPADTPNPVVRFLIQQNTLASARITAHYKR